MNLIACPDLLSVTVEAPATKRCPFKDEIDTGTVTVVWNSEGKTLELHSLREYLDAFVDVKMSHEDFTAVVTAQLADLLGDIQVWSEWETAGMKVRVDAVPFRRLES
jgi:NADPH-dependent 7-cyano-7-deazaguanine reductase QueF